MQINKNVLKSINNSTTRLEIAMACKTTEQTVIRWIKDNHDNLTKAAALNVIREHTKLKDNQILC